MSAHDRVLRMSLGAVLGVTSPFSQAAVLLNGDLLTINPGVVADYDTYGNPVGVSGGSWFAVDTNGDRALLPTEQFRILSAGTDGGLLIGETQAPGDIDYSYFFGSDAWLYTVSAPVSGDGVLDLTGLRWSWNSTNWTLGGGAWVPTNAADIGVPTSGYSDGQASFSWSGIYGDSYSLWYAATEPLGSPTGCGGCQFFWHLEGIVMHGDVPVPASAWLFASGLLGLFGWRRTAC